MTQNRFFQFDDPHRSRAYNLFRENLLRLALHAFRRKNSKLKSRALIIPPCGDPGSLGDHAMLAVATAQLRSAGCKTIHLASSFSWHLVPEPDGLLSWDPNAGFSSRLHTLRSLRDYDYVCLIGADVVDGVYGTDILDRLALLALAAGLGCRTSILGASFRESADSRAIAALLGLPRSVAIHARDPLSQARMERQLDRPILLCGDLAALLPEDSSHPDAVEATRWIAAQRKSGRRIVGINFNGMGAVSRQPLVDAFESFTKRLCAADCALVLIPHDRRDHVSDIEALHELRRRLSPVTEPAHFVPVDSVAATRAVLGQLDFLATGRMHAAILAMSSGVPTLSFPYNGKFEGLYAMMGLGDEGLLVSLSDLIDDPDATSGRILDALNTLPELRTKLAAAAPAYQAAAMRNFADLPNWKWSPDKAVRQAPDLTVMTAQAPTPFDPRATR